MAGGRSAKGKQPAPAEREPDQPSPGERGETSQGTDGLSIEGQVKAALQKMLPSLMAHISDSLEQRFERLGSLRSGTAPRRADPGPSGSRHAGTARSGSKRAAAAAAPGDDPDDPDDDSDDVDDPNPGRDGGDRSERRDEPEPDRRARPTEPVPPISGER